MAAVGLNATARPRGRRLGGSRVGAFQRHDDAAHALRLGPLLPGLPALGAARRQAGKAAVEGRCVGQQHQRHAGCRGAQRLQEAAVGVFFGGGAQVHQRQPQRRPRFGRQAPGGLFVAIGRGGKHRTTAARVRAPAPAARAGPAPPAASARRRAAAPAHGACRRGVRAAGAGNRGRRAAATRGATATARARPTTPPAPAAAAPRTAPASRHRDGSTAPPRPWPPGPGPRAAPPARRRRGRRCRSAPPRGPASWPARPAPWRRRGRCFASRRGSRAPGRAGRGPATNPRASAAAARCSSSAARATASGQPCRAQAWPQACRGALPPGTRARRRASQARARLGTTAAGSSRLR